MNECNDAELVSFALAGEREAFSILITRHEARVRNTVLAVFPSTYEVEDVLQEAFLQAFLNLATLRDPARFRAWVCGIALNMTRMKQRAASTTFIPWQGIGLRDETLFGHHFSPERQLEEKQKLTQLSEAMADLPPSEREALLMIYRDGYSHRETAVQLNTTPNAIKVRAHRGRRRLQKMLQPSEADEQSIKQEKMMIAVTIYDILRSFDAPQNGFDKEELLSAFLPQLPEDVRKTLIDKSEISWSIPFDIRFKLKELPEDQSDSIQKAMYALLPHRVVLLKEIDGERILPIWIGPYEAELIGVQLQKVEFERPLSHDLIKSLLDVSQTSVKSAAVSRLHEQIYFGELKIQTNGQEQVIDCRPSDALVLATRLNAPIFVAPEVLEAEGVLLGTIEKEEKAVYQWEREGKTYHWQTAMGK